VSGTLFAQRSVEQQDRQRETVRNHEEQHRCPPDRSDPPPPGCVVHSRHPTVWKLRTARDATAVMVNRMKTRVNRGAHARRRLHRRRPEPSVAVYPVVGMHAITAAAIAQSFSMKDHNRSVGCRMSRVVVVVVDALATAVERSSSPIGLSRNDIKTETV